MSHHRERKSLNLLRDADPIHPITSQPQRSVRWGATALFVCSPSCARPRPASPPPHLSGKSLRIRTNARACAGCASEDTVCPAGIGDVMNHYSLNAQSIMRRARHLKPHWHWHWHWHCSTGAGWSACGRVMVTASQKERRRICETDTPTTQGNHHACMRACEFAAHAVFGTDSRRHRECGAPGS